MGNIVGLDLKLDENYLAASVQDIVRASIVQTLGDPSQLVRKAIDATINTKVDKDGKPTSSTWGGEPYLNWLARKTVEGVVSEAMKELVAERADELKAEMKKQLSSKKFAENSAATFVQLMLDATASMYKMPITVGFERPKD